MSQPADWTLPVTSPAFGNIILPQLNDVISGLRSKTSGSAAPSDPIAFDWWMDTTDSTFSVLKMRDKANAVWIPALLINESTGVITGRGGLIQTVRYTSSQTITWNAFANSFDGWLVGGGGAGGGAGANAINQASVGEPGNGGTLIRFAQTLIQAGFPTAALVIGAGGIGVTGTGGTPSTGGDGSATTLTYNNAITSTAPGGKGGRGFVTGQSLLGRSGITNDPASGPFLAEIPGQRGGDYGWLDPASGAVALYTGDGGGVEGIGPGANGYAIANQSANQAQGGNDATSPGTGGSGASLMTPGTAATLNSAGGNGAGGIAEISEYF